MNAPFEQNVSKTKYLETLADNFDKLRMLYIDEFATVYNIEEDFKATEKLKRYLENSCEIDSKLRDMRNDYWEGERHLMKEIRANKLAGNTAYFDYFQNVFLVFFTFIENQFPDVLSEYLGDQTSSYELTEKLLREETRDILSQTECFRAIQFELIMTFAFTEDLYQRENKEYDPLIYGESYDLNRPSKFNYITLRYGAILNKKVVDKIYESLNGNFFNLTKGEFKKHFNSPSRFKKITWRGSQTSLVLLFVGKNLPAIDGIKTLNASKAKMMFDHFVKPDGSSFNEHSLGTMQESVKNYKENEETEEIINLLKKVMEITAKKNKK